MMKWKHIFGALLVFLLLTLLSGGLYGLEDDDRWLVQFRSDTPLARQLSLLGESEWEVVGSDNIGLYVVGRETASHLAAAEEVDYVEKDALVYLGAVPNDPFYAGDSSQWALECLHADAAWDIAVGSGDVTVAVVDSGFFYDHEDNTAGHIRPGLNYLQYPDTKTDTAPSGKHGSMVAGIIGATTGNGVGIAGAAWDVDVVMLHTMDVKGVSPVSRVIAAIYDAIGLYDADIINLSVATTNNSNSLKRATEFAYAKGVIVIAAAGNKGTSAYWYPASFDTVICVGSVGKDLGVSPFSQKNDGITVVAPGEEILSLSDSTAGYASGNGTSFAAPYVAGLAVLALSIDENLTPDEFETLLIETATDLGPPGYDNGYGWGLVNYEALLHGVATEDGVRETPYGEVVTASWDGRVLLDGDKTPQLVAVGQELSVDVSGVNCRHWDLEIPVAVLDDLLAKKGSLKISTRFGAVKLPYGLLSQAKAELAVAAPGVYRLALDKTAVPLNLQGDAYAFPSGLSFALQGAGKTLSGYDTAAIVTLSAAEGSFSTLLRVEGETPYPVSTRANGAASVWNPGLYVLAKRTASFADMAGHWSEGTVLDLYSRFIVNGVSEASYLPARTVTRAEFAAMLVRGLGLGKDGVGGVFSDVPASSWYADAVHTAYNHGIVQGLGNGKFQPLAMVTREQAMVMVANALSLLDAGITPPPNIDVPLGSFSDAGQCSGWAKAAAALLIQEQMIQGYNGKLTPKKPVNRGEAAQMVYNLLAETGWIDARPS